MAPWRIPTLFLFAMLAAAQPEFEVASVKPADPDLNAINLRTPTLHANQGRLTFQNIPLRQVVELAYDVGKGQVDWHEDSADAMVARYDITAKLPEASTRDQIPIMLQSLLADRFGMKFHRENRVIPAYALEVGSGGVKLATAPEGARAEAGCPRSRPPTPGISAGADCRNMTAPEIARAMTLLAPGYFDGSVIDRTGVAGAYDFTLEWMTRVEIDNGVGGPSFFDAVAKLGLKLSPKKEPMDILVIDHMLATPTEN
jgi:uncharacterized protein (TIGR03435 family)